MLSAPDKRNGFLIEIQKMFSEKKKKNDTAIWAVRCACITPVFTYHIFNVEKISV